MKKLILGLALASVLVGCGSNLNAGGKNYETYGLFNPEKKSEKVCYSIIMGNVIWSIILVETIVAPVYFVGFSLWEPVKLKVNAEDKCSNID